MAKGKSLDDLVAAMPSSFAADFRLRPIPKLTDSIAQGGNLVAIFSRHDAAMELWRQDAERSVNERITQAGNTPLEQGAASSTTSTAAPTAPPTSAGVSSVNGLTGDVTLTTDEVPETATNPYMLAPGWIGLFDHNGFGRSNVPSSDTVTIPSGRFLVVPGTFTVDGTLIIDGLLKTV